MNDIRDIKRTINYDIVKKIFGNKENAVDFLLLNGYEKRKLNRQSPVDLFNEIVRIWNYYNVKETIQLHN